MTAKIAEKLPLRMQSGASHHCEQSDKAHQNGECHFACPVRLNYVQMNALWADVRGGV